eukprot:777957_1
MEKLIQFRLLSSTLCLDEYRTLLSNVLDENNMEEFSSMIFNYFHTKMRKQTMEQASDAIEIDTMNQEITRIISQRNPNEFGDDVQTVVPHDPDQQDTKLHEALSNAWFTDGIIQKIASFLPFKSYSKFQCCCRSIFYAANNPSSLYELDPCLLEKCINTDNERQIQLFMKRFERIRKLLVTQHVGQYIRLAKFNNLTHLRLNPTKDDAVVYLSQNTFNWDSIEYLHMTCGCDRNYSFEVIKRCTNVRTLVIHDFYYYDMSKQFADLEWFNLQCLHLTIMTRLDLTIMLKNISNNLQSLTIWPMIGHKPKGLSFSNLVELELHGAAANDIISIVATATQLTHLKLFRHLMHCLAFADYSSAFEKIFEIRSLEYCYIECCQSPEEECADLLRLMKCIGSSFHKKRDVLKLEIDASQHHMSPNEIYETVVTICNTLYDWHTMAYTLILTLDAFIYQREIDELTVSLKQWVDKLENRTVIHSLHNTKVIISNKGLRDNDICN